MKNSTFIIMVMVIMVIMVIIIIIIIIIIIVLTVPGLRACVDIVVSKLHEDALTIWMLANGSVCQSGHEIRPKHLSGALLVSVSLSLRYGRS